MDGFELPWFFMRRMALSGCKVGAMLGAAYGVVVVPAVFLIPQFISELGASAGELLQGALLGFRSRSGVSTSAFCSAGSRGSASEWWTVCCSLP